MNKQILAFLMAMLTGLLIFGCRHCEILEKEPAQGPQPVRWVRFVPEEYVLRG